MKPIRSGALLALVLCGGAILFCVMRANRSQQEPYHNASPNIVSAPDGKLEQTNHSSAKRGNTERAADMTEEEKAVLAQKFGKNFRPAIAKWCSVYSNRIPFTAEDVTLQKFHSVLGGYLYTFMIGDTTLTIKDSKEGARVFYMATRDGLGQLNSVPPEGTARNLSMPVTREEIVGLLKADSGIEYPPDQIQIHPTGASGSLEGGVSVEAGGITGNGVFRAMTLTNLDFVLGPDGKLVYYLR